MKISHQRKFIDRESYIAQYLALALFTIGVASSLGSDDLLAAFAAGTLTPYYSRLMSTRSDSAIRCSSLLGRLLPHPSRERSLLLRNRPRPQLRMFRIHRCVDPIRRIQLSRIGYHTMATRRVVPCDTCDSSDSCSFAFVSLGSGD